MSTTDYANARQQRYEDAWFTITGDDWPVPLHFLERFAQQIAGECIQVAHDTLNDTHACEPVESAIERRFGITAKA